MEFPFAYGHALTEQEFLDRKVELSTLSEYMESGIHTVMISPRLWGKSSLVNQFANRISKHKDFKFIYLNLFGIYDVNRFLEKYIHTLMANILADPPEMRKSSRKYLKKLFPGIFKKGSNQLTNLRLPVDREEVMHYCNEIIEIPEFIAQNQDWKYVICVDDIQFLEKFHEVSPFLKNLRNSWQKHSHVVYFLSGNKKPFTENLFLNENAPFFGFGEILNLPRIRKKFFIKHIMAVFEKSGKTIPKERILKIIGIANRSPYHIHLLARSVWLRSSEMVVDSDIHSAVEEIINQNEIWYAREIEKMSSPQYHYLKAVAEGAYPLSGKEVISKYKLGTSANVAKLKKTMEDRDILDFTGKYPAFVDPFLPLWIRNHENHVNINSF